ncbi:MAG: ROK family protein [Armatimonadota bacterium]
MNACYLGLDVGNSRLSAAIVGCDGRVRALRRCATPQATAAAVRALIELAVGAMGEGGARPLAAGIGFGGPVDLAASRVRGSFLAPGWADVPLGQIVAEGLGLPCFLANDANAAGLGEASFGAGRGASCLLYVNVGTGIGGAVIIEGRLHTGATSAAGEIGHFIVVPDGPPCECGKRGCAQALASGAALGRRARVLLGAGDWPSSLRAVQAGALTGRDVGEAARAGDALAGRVVSEAAGWLGIALANAGHLLDPERIVVGGGVAELGELFLGPLRASYRAHIFGPATQTPLLAAELGYDAGVIGAAAVAMSEQGAYAAP